MIKVYDEGKAHICFEAKDDEDKKVLETLQEHLQVVYEKKGNGSLAVVVRKSEK